MGNKEEDASAKTPKSSSTQEQPPPSSPATVFPDWASFQAYCNSAGTPVPSGFYHSPVASSPQGHPYMWGPQHIIPPYGTSPHPYVAMYPPGGLYPPPTIPLGSHPYNPYAMTSPNGTTDVPVGASGGSETGSKLDEGKERSPTRRSKVSLGSLNTLTGKNNERDKISGASANGIDSQSDESESEDSSEGSDANSQKGSHQSNCCEKNTVSGDTKNAGNDSSDSAKAVQATQSSTVSNHVSPTMAIPSGAANAPTTTLNIGMDCWGGNSASVAPVRSKLPITPSPAAVATVREAASDMWLQDERELKRQRRKQSNRESARRSRLRKQAEYEELARRVGSLNEENHGLREELSRMQEECEKLASENSSLAEKLKMSRGGESRRGAGRSESASGAIRTSDAKNAQSY